MTDSSTIRAAAPNDPASNQFLSGNFAPVTEETTAFDLEVTSSIPPALTGRYVRTGPNPLAADAETYHWFGGDGMLHGVDLRGGAATWYRNRWVRSPEASAHFGEPETARDEGGWYPGSGNTNVFHHAGRVWAVTEGSLPYEISTELDTIRASNFGGQLPGGINAHPKFDPETNELHALSYGFEPPYVRYHVIDTAGRVTRTEAFDLPAPVMVHDLGFTATRLVVFDLPVVFNWDLALAGVSLPFRWDPAHHSRIGVMPRAGSGADTVWIDVEPCYVYHPLNGFDDGDHVVLDLVVHPRAFDDERGSPVSETPTLQRWVIDPAGRRVSTTVVDDHSQEFPRADERLAGRPHRYGYSLGTSSVLALGGLGAGAETMVLKHDTVAGTTTARPLGPGQVGGEFVFVPASETAGEDEGWLLGYVYDGTRGASDLVILDAHDFGGEPVARVHLPARVPQGFHGNWMPDSALA
jgi:carotenoid cleavage dioxygenase